MKKIWKLLLTLCLVAGFFGCMYGLAKESRREAFLEGKPTLEKPALSHESGMYPEAFYLEIAPQKESEIYYTMDGSIPTAQSIKYEGPIWIDATGDPLKVELPGDSVEAEKVADVIRAVAVNADGEYSDEVSAVYLVGDSELNNNTILSLIADPEELFGEEGIYVAGKAYEDYLAGIGEETVPNYLKRGDEWERKAIFDIFEEEKLLLEQPVGIRIQGASARTEPYKRFSIFARKEYSGSNYFAESIFDEEIPLHSIVLRKGFMNGFITHMMKEREADVASAENKEVIVLLNGYLWYVTLAQEKYSSYYFKEHYGMDRDNVIIVKAGQLEHGREEDYLLYQQIYEYLESHPMETGEAYDGFCELVDMQSYIEFSCINLFFGNLDYNETKNCICFRSRKKGRGEYEDGRWRWALYDMDLENLNYGWPETEINTYNLETYYAGGAFNTRYMYTTLKQNPEFRRQFVTTFLDMLNEDFTLEAAQSAMENYNIHMEWWGKSQEWMEWYFMERPGNIREYTAEEFGLKGRTAQLVLDVDDASGGGIRLNTISPDLSKGEWRGIYFTDYPVTLEAVPREGYRFAGWKAEDEKAFFSTDRKTELELEEGETHITAVFEKMQ